MHQGCRVGRGVWRRRPNRDRKSTDSGILASAHTKLRGVRRDDMAAEVEAAVARLDAALDAYRAELGRVADAARQLAGDG